MRFCCAASRRRCGALNTTVNSFVFLAMFLGQWLVGLVLELWPRSGAANPPQAYHWRSARCAAAARRARVVLAQAGACLRTGELT